VLELFHAFDSFFKIGTHQKSLGYLQLIRLLHLIVVTVTGFALEARHQSYQRLEVVKIRLFDLGISQIFGRESFLH